MFAACYDAAVGKLFDKSPGEPRDLFGIMGQASFKNYGSRCTKVEYWSKIDIESGSFEFGRDNARSDPELCCSRIRKLRHGWNRPEDLFQAIDTAALMIDSEERLNRKHLAQTVV